MLSSLKPANGKFVLGPPVETTPPVVVFTGPADHPDPSSRRPPAPRPRIKRRPPPRPRAAEKPTKGAAAEKPKKTDDAKPAKTAKPAKQPKPKVTSSTQ